MNAAIGTDRITIGMPVYDNERTVARAIASVLAQTRRDWRLIVTDDGSSDDTLAEARRAAQSDPRIEIRRNPERLGAGNFGLSLKDADTPYFVWLAGDDYWHADFLLRTSEALDAAPAAVSALPDGVFLTADKEAIPNLGFLRGGPAERVRRYLSHPGGTRMYGLMRTVEAQRAFPSRPGHAYDWYLVVALLARGPQLHVPAPLLFRERTDWSVYARAGADRPARGLRRSFPILDISMALLRDRRIPIRAVPALMGLNLRKHEEYLAVNRPAAFLRRAPLYRRLGLPIARNPGRLLELAELHRAAGAQGAIVSGFAARGGPGAIRTVAAAPAGETVTAIVTCRNAEATLGAWLEHAARQGCRVVLVDHGSTDSTREIAEACLGGQVARIVEAPYRGCFDLTEQLELKRSLFPEDGRGWVWHADADDFLDAGSGRTLTQMARAAEVSGKLAFACEEALFMPRFEDEAHAPDSFRETMTAPFTVGERYEKQRLFRASAPLDLWFRTGGHSVTRDPAALADERLQLSHYIALSLDDLRGQYLSRVFAPRDVFKLWHLNRAAARGFDIVAPGDLDDRQGVLPAFAPRSVLPQVVPAATDIVVLSAHDEDRSAILSALNAAVPGLRVWLSTATEAAAGAIPVLSVLSHPGRLHEAGLTRGGERAIASDWVRRVATARQNALERGTPYGEVRLEDIDSGRVDLVEVLRRLYLGRIATGPDGFLSPGSADIEVSRYHSPVRDITRGLAADLGYR